MLTWAGSAQEHWGLSNTEAETPTARTILGRVGKHRQSHPAAGHAAFLHRFEKNGRLHALLHRRATTSFCTSAKVAQALSKTFTRASARVCIRVHLEKLGIKNT